jgi:formylmethanofuran dehydrogenase subunit A
MLTRLHGAQICDPSRSSALIDETLFIQDDQLVSPSPKRKIDADFDLSECIAMAGGIDIHTHIGGGKTNLARLLLPERRLEQESPELEGIKPLSSPVPGTWETGRRYLEMGYTACFEPAVLPMNARQAHLEMADTPWLDTGGYLMLGNEELLLKWLADDVPQTQINDYVGWMLKTHRCLAVKVVNAGGISAFKNNQRSLDVDESHSLYGLSPRKILKRLALAVDSLQLAHPLHVHCSNLGKPGNISSTLATIDAVEECRLHLTHAQFHCYGNDGPHGFSSAASELADRVNKNPKLSIDVGQVLFGQTVTISGDVMHQFANRRLAHPRKSVFSEIECQAGCGVLPFRYRQSQYVHGLQWSIGLELFLLIEDATRIFLTTDHPNGAPFTSYPHLIRLLMDYDFRMSIFEQLHPDVRKTSRLPELKREYSLHEIATMTRWGPAKSLGLNQTLGHLGPGAGGDVVVYRKQPNPQRMFAQPEMIFRRGKLVYRDGEFKASCSPKRRFESNPDFDSSIEKPLRRDWDDYYSVSMEALCRSMA